MEQLLEEMEARLCNVQTLALLLPPPAMHLRRRWPPEEVDRMRYDRTCIETITWQARTIRELVRRLEEA